VIVVGGRAGVFALLLVSSAAPVANAQSTETVSVGARVRLRTTTDVDWVEGVAVGLGRDSLVLSRCGSCDDRLPFHARDVLELETRDGGLGSRGTNAAIGAGIGIVASFIWLHQSVKSCERGGPTDGPPCSLGYVFWPMTATIGAFGGGLIGILVPPARWTPAELPRD